MATKVIRDARDVRFELRFTKEESIRLTRIRNKMGLGDDSKTIRRLMEMYETNELAVDAVLEALRKFEAEKVVK
jgi:hypothetical protein